MLSRHGASFSSSHGQEFGDTSLGAVVVGQSIEKSMSQQNSGQQVYFGFPPRPTLGLVLNIYERQLFFFSTFVRTRTVIVGKMAEQTK